MKYSNITKLSFIVFSFFFVIVYSPIHGADKDSHILVDDDNEIIVKARGTNQKDTQKLTGSGRMALPWKLTIDPTGAPLPNPAGFPPLQQRPVCKFSDLETYVRGLLDNGVPAEKI